MATLATTKSDHQIQAEVLEELKWDPTVEETEVGVQVGAGIVTLTGSVTAYAKKIAAVAAAHRVRGVLDVVDNLKVNVPTSWERTDQEIAATVRDALKWDVMVPDRRIKSTVSAGSVTLEGVVTNWAERYNAERAIQHLTGVRDVVNRITVEPRHVDPLEIKRHIEEALERQTEREAHRLTVAVADGVVTITGTVKSWGEKNALERVAWATPGVRRIEDQTVVDPCL